MPFVLRQPDATPPSATSARRVRRWTPSALPRGSSSPLYRPRRPTATPLYPLVQHHLQTFLARADEAARWATASPGGWSGTSAPFRAAASPPTAFRACAAATGGRNASSRSLAKAGVCPSCNRGPHEMHAFRGVGAPAAWPDVAARLTDHVFLQLRLRQWVLSVPKRLRPSLHHDARLAGRRAPHLRAPGSPSSPIPRSSVQSFSTWVSPTGLLPCPRPGTASGRDRLRPDPRL
jgi:hypothetical protein